MTFIEPSQLSLLLFIPLLLAFLLWRSVARAQAVRRLGDAKLIAQLTAQVSYVKRRWKLVLWLMCLTLLAIAIARPSVGYERETVVTLGEEVVFVVDVSLSMDAEDVSPSRIERARADLVSIVQSWEKPSAGVVLFADTSRAFLPFTNKNTLIRMARYLNTRVLSQQGTAIAGALNNVLEAYLPQGKMHVVLMSDGEDHEGNLAQVLERYLELDIPVHTITYGTVEGAFIPVKDATGQRIGYKTDANNVIVNSSANPERMAQIALATGGQAFTADTLSPQTFASFVTSQSELEAEQTRPAERFPLLVALAFVLISLEMWLSEGRDNLL
jgi:Ca-activated chloride channel family protein